MISPHRRRKGREKEGESRKCDKSIKEKKGKEERRMCDKSTKEKKRKVERRREQKV